MLSELTMLTKVVISIAWIACLLFILVIPLQSQGLEIIAVAGDQYGVCSVNRPLEPDEQGLPASSHALFELISNATVQEANNRALYPVWCIDSVDRSGSKSIVLYFLFKGQDELDLSISLSAPMSVRSNLIVKPTMDARLNRQMLNGWWQAYIARIEMIEELDIYEPTVEFGIAAIMKRRLGFDGELPDFFGRRDRGGNRDFDDAFALLLGTESIRLAMQAKTLLDTKGNAGLADKPLPNPVAAPEMPVPPFNNSIVKVEPIALRVPAECFYLRFGSFPGFFDSMDFLGRWGIAFRSAISSRSVDFEIMQRLERQLAINETALRKFFGGAVLQDAAIIGTDFFIKEGASIGILFQAKQNSILKGQLESMRKDIAKADPDAVETIINISGCQVSLLLAQGNAVRSFYVQDGDFHLIATSRWMIENFLATRRKPQNALGGLEEFRYARSRINPSEKGIFVYLSDPFFRNLVSPSYRIEMARRANSIVEMQMAALARMVAAREGSESSDVGSLIKSGFLPRGFGNRPDSSKLIMQNGRFVDSLRGSVGSMLPIADVLVEGATEAEVDAYYAFSEAYEGIWTNMDPVFGNLKMQKSDGGQKFELRLSISPYARSRYDFFLPLLGKPLKDRIALAPGTLLSAEVRLNDDLLSLLDEASNDGYEDEDDEDGEGVAAVLNKPKPLVTEKPYAMRLFAGLRDAELPYILESGSLNTGEELLPYISEHLKGYVGAVIPNNRKFTIDMFFPKASKPDAKGYYRVQDSFRESPSRSAKGRVSAEYQAWARKFDPFLVIGTGRSLLETVSPHIKIQSAEQPAQLRVTLGDFSSTSIGRLIKAKLYAADRRISAGGAMQLQSIQQQLNPKDPAMALQELQDQKLTCPIGGQYIQDSEQPGLWKSTAWQEPTLFQTNQVPINYSHPILDGMKWLRIDFSIDPNALNTRLEIQAK
jgi:hypothetical protein